MYRPLNNKAYRSNMHINKMMTKNTNMLI